jgi:hypothetical protein
MYPLEACQNPFVITLVLWYLMSLKGVILIHHYTLGDREQGARCCSCLLAPASS